MKKSFIKDENGEVVVEASLVFPIVLMVIFFIMYLGFIMYQQTMLTVVANDTASSIAQVYSTSTKDPFVGFTTTDQLSNTKLYRSLYNAVQSIAQSSNSMDSKNEEKGIWYAKYRLVSSRLYKESGSFQISVDYERQKGTFLQKNVVVTIKATYDLPILRFFGIRDSQKHFAAQGRAECMDLLDYASTLSLIDQVAEDVIDPVSGKIVEIGDKLSKGLESIKEFSRKINEEDNS